MFGDVFVAYRLEANGHEADSKKVCVGLWSTYQQLGLSIAVGGHVGLQGANSLVG